MARFSKSDDSDDSDYNPQEGKTKKVKITPSAKKVGASESALNTISAQALADCLHRLIAYTRLDTHRSNVRCATRTLSARLRDQVPGPVVARTRAAVSIAIAACRSATTNATSNAKVPSERHVGV
jgi:hypothetical protein